MDSEWQIKLTSWKQRISYILKTGLRSDCCFLVGVVPENQRLFQAHKFVLSNASPVFERMFYGSIPEKENQPIEIDDIDADDFNNLLQFIYTEEISLVSIDRAQQLYYAAHKYMMNQLMQKCIDFLTPNITTDNVCGILEFAQQFEEKDFEKACMKFITKNTSAVLLSSTLLQANILTLNLILSQDKLKISSELELFNALQRYADVRLSIDQRRNSISSTQLTANKSEAVTVENGDTINQNANKVATTSSTKKTQCSSAEKCHAVEGSNHQQMKDFAHFLDLIKKIRFRTLSSQQFASGPALSKLLSKSDALGILICIVDPKNLQSHFPHGFSDSTKQRTYQ